MTDAGRVLRRARATRSAGTGARLLRLGRLRVLGLVCRGGLGAGRARTRAIRLRPCSIVDTTILTSRPLAQVSVPKDCQRGVGIARSLWRLSVKGHRPSSDEAATRHAQEPRPGPLLRREPRIDSLGQLGKIARVYKATAVRAAGRPSPAESVHGDPSSSAAAIDRA